MNYDRRIPEGTADGDKPVLTKLLAMADIHGPEVFERMLELVRERAESFPDRERQVVWSFGVSDDGTVTLEVRP